MLRIVFSLESLPFWFLAYIVAIVAEITWLQGDKHLKTNLAAVRLSLSLLAFEIDILQNEIK